MQTYSRSKLHGRRCCYFCFSLLVLNVRALFLRVYLRGKRQCIRKKSTRPANYILFIHLLFSMCAQPSVLNEHYYCTNTKDITLHRAGLTRVLKKVKDVSLHMQTEIKKTIVALDLLHIRL